MKNLLLAVAFFALGICVEADMSPDEANTRGTNAANVATAGLNAAQNSRVKGNCVPYLSSNSYMTSAMGVIGGILHIYHNYKMQKEFKDAMNELNGRFDQLEADMNSRFNDVEGLIDRKQFESDITDPTSILWGEMQMYAQYPNNQTYLNMRFECTRQVPWQIATKLRNRLYGPDNTIMTQIKSNQYNNATFMATKDVIMYRMFQLMMVQSFCIGVQYGPNYNVTQDWSMSLMNQIYYDIVNNTVKMRIQQETDYLNAVGQDLITKYIESIDWYYADNLRKALLSNYQWDDFGVVVSDHNCLNDHLGIQGPSNGGQGYIPYSIFRGSISSGDVYIIRFWSGADAYDGGYRFNNYQSCMGRYYDSDPVKWAENINCGQSLDFLSNDWYCGKSVRYAGPDNSRYFVRDAQYSGTWSTGTSSAVFPNSNRPTTVEYDLGFWERPISISLLPYSN